MKDVVTRGRDVRGHQETGLSRRRQERVGTLRDPVEESGIWEREMSNRGCIYFLNFAEGGAM